MLSIFKSKKKEVLLTLVSLSIALIFIEIVSFYIYPFFTGIDQGSNITSPHVNEPIWLQREIIHPYLGFVKNCPVIGSNRFGFFGPEPTIGNNDNKLTVAFFGGSVSQSLYNSEYAQKKLTDTLKSIDRFKNKDVEIVSFALGGYKQPQQLFTLIYFMIIGIQLDIIINLDGFNEVALPYTENLPTNVSSFYPRNWALRTNKLFDRELIYLQAKIEQLKETREKHVNAVNKHLICKSNIVKLIRQIFINRCTNQLINHNIELMKLISDTEINLQTTGPEKPFKDDYSAFKRFAEIWKISSLHMSRICKANGILYFHFLQPNQYHNNSKKLTIEELETAYADKDYPYRTAVENTYHLLINEGEFLRNGGVNFTDLTMIFKDEKQSIYIDTCCHVNDLGNMIFADRISDVLRKHFKPDRV